MSRRQLPWCEVCNAPIRHRGRAGRFCGRRCSGIGTRRIGEHEIMRIAAARMLQIQWATIGREIGASTATIQRAAKRSGVRLALPPWIQREERSMLIVIH
jgi:hypothetical protein